MNRQAIGFLDSGLGGLTVLAEAVRELPKESFIYYGDTSNAPYGDKSEQEVILLVEKAVNRLLAEGCKAIVLACNTATAVAAEELRRKYAFPIIGIEPALKPASLLPGDGKIVVLATQLTLSMPKFRTLMNRFAPDAVLVPCPGLMECVEAGELSGAKLDALLQKFLAPVQTLPVKALVLGCTHYPFLKQEIAKYFLPEVQIIDGSAGTARQLRRRLTECDLLTDAEAGSIRLISSGSETEIQKMRHMLALLCRAEEKV